MLWLGRLSFFEKAYPQGMFIALQKAAQRCGRRLHFVMAGWFPGGETDHSCYQEAAQCHAPDVPVHFLDGKNPEVVRCCWAAADLFLSLVDNPQETFGLAPVEAMAAGLPVVVSDWDGYRYTVSDGVEGFRFPTLAPAHARQGEDLALQHDHGLLTYQDYVGAVAQHVAVDTEAAAAAIARLAEDPELRQRMGEAGRQTVQQRFDWSVVARLHHQLYAELAERRLPVRIVPAWRLSTRCGVTPSAILPRLLPPASGPKPSSAWRCLCLSYSTGSATSPAWIVAMSNSMPAQQMFSDCWSAPRRGGQSCSLMRLLSAWPVGAA